MPPPPDLSSYRLSDHDINHVFQTEILPAELSDVPPSPSPKPLAVLAVGQTGAGKTRLSPAILSALGAASRSPAHFIADTYKTYHPSFARLMQTAPHLASPATSDDARRWLAMAAVEATERRLDVVLESACRHPDDFTSLARIFHDAGYRVEVAVLAVPEALSRLGILTRYYEKLPEAQTRNLPVRLTPTKVHDDSYQGLLHVATFLDDSRTADQVVMLRRGNLVVYEEEKGSDGKMRGGIADAVRRERDRPLTEDEARIAMEDVRKLSEMAQASEQLAVVRELLQPLIGQEAEKRRAQYPPMRPLVLGIRKGEEPVGAVLRLGETQE